MTKLLQLEISCGETTCASEPGKFCSFLSTRRFGTITYCQIFSEVDLRGRELPLELKDGWTQRHPLCMKNTVYCDHCDEHVAESDGTCQYCRPEETND